MYSLDVRTYCDTITTDCVNGNTATTNFQWDVIAYRVNGQFLNLYKPKYAGDTYKQCVNTWGIGSNDYTKCTYNALSTISAGCTNNGVMAEASEVTIGLAALFGALSFF